MAIQQATVNKQTFYLVIIVVFIAGFVSGVGYSVFKTSRTSTTSAPPAASSGPTQQEKQAILNLEAEVTANPENYNAWTQLGHLYFDTDQYHKAIGAYEKALELNPSNANTWTDLGVMHRRAGDSAKALEAFDRAISLDASHQPSRLNKGIVLYYDFGKTDEAIASWEDVLKMNPDSRTANGTLLKDFVAQIKKELANAK